MQYRESYCSGKKYCCYNMLSFLSKWKCQMTCLVCRWKEKKTFLKSFIFFFKLTSTFGRVNGVSVYPRKSATGKSLSRLSPNSMTWLVFVSFLTIKNWAWIVSLSRFVWKNRFTEGRKIKTCNSNKYSIREQRTKVIYLCTGKIRILFSPILPFNSQHRPINTIILTRLYYLNSCANKGFLIKLQTKRNQGKSLLTWSAFSIQLTEYTSPK